MERHIQNTRFVNILFLNYSRILNLLTLNLRNQRKYFCCENYVTSFLWQQWQKCPIGYEKCRFSANNTNIYSWFQDSAAKYTTNMLSWVVRQRVVVILYRRFGTTFPAYRLCQKCADLKFLFNYARRQSMTRK